MRRHEIIVSFPFHGTQLEFAAYGPVWRESVEFMIKMMEISLECFDPMPTENQQDDTEVTQ